DFIVAEGFAPARLGRRYGAWLGCDSVQVRIVEPFYGGIRTAGEDAPTEISTHPDRRAGPPCRWFGNEDEGDSEPWFRIHDSCGCRSDRTTLDQPHPECCRRGARDHWRCSPALAAIGRLSRYRYSGRRARTFQHNESLRSFLQAETGRIWHRAGVEPANSRGSWRHANARKPRGCDGLRSPPAAEALIASFETYERIRTICSFPLLRGRGAAP